MGVKVARVSKSPGRSRHFGLSVYSAPKFARSNPRRRRSVGYLFSWPLAKDKIEEMRISESASAAATTTSWSLPNAELIIFPNAPATVAFSSITGSSSNRRFGSSRTDPSKERLQFALTDAARALRGFLARVRFATPPGQIPMTDVFQWKRHSAMLSADRAITSPPPRPRGVRGSWRNRLQRADTCVPAGRRSRRQHPDQNQPCGGNLTAHRTTASSRWASSPARYSQCINPRRDE